MKRIFRICILGMLLLSACEKNTGDVPTESVIISDIYTAAAMTIEAQVTPTAFPTATPMPATFTSTPSSLVIVDTSTPVSSSLSSVSYSTAYGCYDAAYLSDVTIPDGTVLTAGESFTKTWQFQNTGSCAWEEDFLLTFVSGDDMDGADTVIDTSVAVGGSGSISVTLVAPDTAGTYTGYWRLATADGNGFGGNVYVMIVVSSDAVTSTPTSTSTATATTVVEDTATPIPDTDTPVPDPTEDTTEETGG